MSFSIINRDDGVACVALEGSLDSVTMALAREQDPDQRPPRAAAPSGLRLPYSCPIRVHLPRT